MTFPEEADQIYPGWKEKLDPAPERPRRRVMNRRRDGGLLPARAIEKPKAASHYSIPSARYMRGVWALEPAPESEP